MIGTTCAFPRNNLKNAKKPPLLAGDSSNVEVALS